MPPSFCVLAFHNNLGYCHLNVLSLKATMIRLHRVKFGELWFSNSGDDAAHLCILLYLCSWTKIGLFVFIRRADIPKRAGRLE